MVHGLNETNQNEIDNYNKFNERADELWKIL
jgi:hypothetical protein